MDGRKGGRKEEPVERGVQRGSLRGVTAKVWLGTLARQVGSARWYPSQGAWRSLGTQMILTFPSRVNPSLGRARDSLQVTGYRERSQQRHGPLVGVWYLDPSAHWYPESPKVPELMYLNYCL